MTYIEGLEDEWQLAEDRMPEGWTVRSLIRISGGWEVVGDSPERRNIGRGLGATPIAALRNLWEPWAAQGRAKR